MNKLKALGVIILIIIILIGVGFATGEISALYNKTVGKDITNSENVKFHNTQIYNDSMAKDLADAKRELGQTTDPTAKGTWVMLIDQKTKKATPVLMEPDIITSQFKLRKEICDPTSLPSNY